MVQVFLFKLDCTCQVFVLFFFYLVLITRDAMVCRKRLYHFCHLSYLVSSSSSCLLKQIREVHIDFVEMFNDFI